MLPLTNRDRYVPILGQQTVRDALQLLLEKSMHSCIIRAIDLPTNTSLEETTQKTLARQDGLFFCPGLLGV